MNIALAMLLAAFTNLARKVWGQDIVDKAVETVFIYCAEHFVKWTHYTEADDEMLDYIKAKLKKANENGQ